MHARDMDEPEAPTSYHTSEANPLYPLIPHSSPSTFYIPVDIGCKIIQTEKLFRFLNFLDTRGVATMRPDWLMRSEVSRPRSRKYEQE